jgi:hypothetical protein
MPTSIHYHPASYRDPSGFIFEKDGIIYRQVNDNFKEHFDYFINSGCYEKLVKNGWLIPHEVIHENLTQTNEWYLTLKPEQIGFISYPYEWSFDMLKDAALLTLKLVKEAIAYGLILKDATPYNIQWHRGKLIFIDTLSFEKYNEQEPWIAYRQFCECFLSPLLLMHYSKTPLHEMLLAYPDGIPLVVTRSLLPWRSKFSLHTYLHIHMHAKLSVQHAGKSQGQAKFSKQKLLNLISSLEGLIKKVRLPSGKSTWSDYYNEALQRNDYLEQKQKIIEKWMEQLQNISTATDLGANEGEFSKLLAKKNIQTTATDFDHLAINKLYTHIKTTRESKIQPLIIDLANPSASSGLNNEERSSFIHRTHVDLVLALALIHHLAIGKNIPFEKIAFLLAGMCRYLIIEFVPKDDPKTAQMLKQKKDIYSSYDEKYFINTFTKKFSILEQLRISGTGRILFLMERL